MGGMTAALVAARKQSPLSALVLAEPTFEIPILLVMGDKKKASILD